VGRSGVPEHKSDNISEMRKDRGKVTIWRAYGNSPALFRMVLSPTSFGLLFPKIGVCNPHPKLQSLLSQQRVKLQTSNLAGTFQGSMIHPNKSPLKFRRKGSEGECRDCANFLSTPIISGTRKATNFKFCAHIHGNNGTKAHYKFRQK